MNCDWCIKNGELKFGEAKFVVATGRIDTMEVEAWFICMMHAEKICADHNRVVRRRIAGVVIDEFELHSISEKAQEFYHDRFVAGVPAVGGTGNIPDPLTQPFSGSIRRERRFYWDTGEIRIHIPVY